MEQIHSCFINCFGDVDALVPLSDITFKVTDGVHNTVIDEPGSGYRLLSCKNLKSGRVEVGSNEREIGKETFQKLRRRTSLAKGDILIASVGSIGEVVLLDEEPSKIEFQRSVAIIKPNPNVVSSLFLYEAILFRKSDLVNMAHGAVQQCLFISDIASFQVPLPASKQAIEAFDSFAYPLFSAITANRRETLRLETLRDSLLPKLMSGEIDVDSIDIG